MRSRYIVGSLLLPMLIGIACARHASEPARFYQLSGKVVALNSKDQTATIDAAAIPNWMEAMTMEYPIKSPGDFNTLRVGEKILGKIAVRSPGEYELTEIHEDKSRPNQLGQSK